MFRFLKRRKLAWLMATLALGSSAAWAAGRSDGPGGCGGGGCGGGGCGHRRGPGGHGEFMKARIDAHLADLSDVAKATPEQKKALEAARDRILARMQAHRGPGAGPQGQGQGQGAGKAQGRGGPAEGAAKGQDEGPRAAHLRKLQALLLADAPDPKRIEALRDQHLKHRAEMAEGLVQELGQLHGVFSADQRKAMAGYLQDLLPGQRGQWRERMGRFWAGRMIDRVADQIKASPEQKKALSALAEKGGDAFKAHHQTRQQHLQKAIALWQGDKWDAAQVKALQASLQDQGKVATDAMIRLALEAHKILTPAQRKAAADLVGRRGMSHHGHGPGGFGGPPQDDE